MMFVSKDFFDDNDDTPKQDEQQKSNALKFRYNKYQKEFDTNDSILTSNNFPHRPSTPSTKTGNFSTFSIENSTARRNSAVKPLTRIGGNNVQSFLYGGDEEVTENKSFKAMNNSSKPRETPVYDNQTNETIRRDFAVSSNFQNEKDNSPQEAKKAERVLTRRVSLGGDERQQLLLKQKQRLLDQQRMQNSGYGIIRSNDMPIYRNQQPNIPLYSINEEKKDTNIIAMSGFVYEVKKETHETSNIQNNSTPQKPVLNPSNNGFSADKESEELDDDSDKDDDDELDATQLAELEKKELEKKESQKRNTEINGQQNMMKEEKVKTTIEKNHSTSLKGFSLALVNYDSKAFLMNPAPENCTIRCTIKRDRSGFARFFNKYYLSLTNEYRFLLAAKKGFGNKTSNYTISSSSKDFKTKSTSFLGKLRSNFMGTKFNIWDNGLNPKKTNVLEKVRGQLGVVLYESNFMGKKGPRKMKILIPRVTSTGKRCQFKPLSSKEGMDCDFSNGKMEGIHLMYNKPPEWNEGLQGYVLNFQGRVKKASVKNFQLIDEKDEDLIYLLFGKIDNDTFAMDFQWPLSPFQAFAICLSSFDYKIGCE